jgi:hypothetical protein
MTLLCDFQQDAPNFTKVMEDCHQSYMQHTQGKKGRNRNRKKVEVRGKHSENRQISTFG